MSQSCGQSCSSGTCSQTDKAACTLTARMKDIRCKLLVLSGKGGVGKSTVAVNLAVALAAKGHRVGLLDVDLHGPSVPGLLGMPSATVEQMGSEVLPVRVRDNLAALSVAWVLPGRDQAVIWRGPMKHGVIEQFLRDVAWGTLDFLVVDAPPGTGDEPLTVAQLAGDDAAAVIVTTPQNVAVADVRRCLSFCRKMKLPVAGIVENMSGFACPHCGEHVALLGSGGGDTLAAESQSALLGRIPIDPAIVASGDAGKPFAADGTGPGAAAFRDIADALEARYAAGNDRADPVPTPKEPQTMIIAIPVADGALSMHFGHCETFALVTVDAANKTILDTQLCEPPPHEPGVLPRWLKEKNADIVLAGGMGQRAQALFAEQGVKVVVGAQGGTPEELAQAYLTGSLATGANVCDH